MEYQALPVTVLVPPSNPAVQAYSFVQDTEYDPYNNVSSQSSLNLAVLLLVVTCPAFALVPGLLSEWYLGIAGCVFTIIQLGIAVLTCIYRGKSWGLLKVRATFIVYTWVLLAAVLAYEGWSLQAQIRHHWAHCEDYVMYTVCRKRGGLMTTDLVLALFYPFIDLMIAVCCVFVLRCLRDRHRSLQRQEK